MAELMKDLKIIARQWQPQDLLDDLQMMIDEQPDGYLNTDRTTLCTAKAYLEEHFNQWIKASERLPEIDEDVLCCGNHGNIFIGHYLGGTYTGGVYAFWNPSKHCGCGVTHWAKLPNLPK